MSEEERVACVQCGAGILVATSRRTGGLCMPCEKSREIEMREANKPPLASDGLQIDARKNPPGTVLALKYIPGFTADGTSWVTRVSKQGKISQEILWDRPGESARSEVMEAGPLAAETLDEVKQRMAALLAIGVSASDMVRLNMMDDVQLAELFFPDGGFSMRIPLHEHLDPLYPSTHLSEKQMAAVAAFEAIWDLIDEHCPQRVPRFQSRPWLVKNVPPAAGD